MFIHISVTVCVLAVFIDAENCPIREVNDTLLSCFDGANGGQQVDLIGQHVTMGTECIISNGKTVSTLKCKGPDWEYVNDILSAESLPRERRQLFVRHKRGWFSNIVGGIFHGIACAMTLFSCLWAGRPGPPPDRTAPIFTYCPEPPHIKASPEPFQTWAQVTWQEPTAYDNVDGNIRPQLVQGRPSGRHFPGDQTTTVRYIAKDRSGNVNYCNIDIEVKVIRCPKPPVVQNGYFSCFPTTEYLLGGHCQFGCYDGYELVGDSVRYCQANSSWTGSQNYQPYCKEIECPALPIVEGAGMPLCTNGNKFKSVCTYNCLSGYDMPPRVSKALACTSQKTWRSFGQPKCVDVESPQFQYCPSVQIFGTDPGLNTSKVFWDQPIVVDNSDDASNRILALLKQESRSPYDQLVAGTYAIEYSATDKQGNTARPCIFNVIVRDVRCPRLYPTPYQQISCPSGFRSQSFCSISCSGSRVLDTPSNDVQCEQQSGQLFGKWKWSSGRQPVCKTTNFCDPLPAPANGAVACDNWYQGKYCQVQCRNGTRMTGGLPSDLFVCSPTATWSMNPDLIRPCQIERHPRPHVGIEATFYFDGECTSPTAKQEIAQNFIDKLSMSGFSNEICIHHKDECQPQNVQITCGESSRKRRDTDTVYNVSMIIHFELPVPVLLQEDTYADDQRQVYKLYESLKFAIENMTEEMFGNRSSLLEITNTGIGVTCPDGSVKSETGLSCLDCPQGTFFDRRTTECKSCTKGFYQDRAGLSSCARCPYTKTTKGSGSVSFQDCEDACEPGSYSSDGIVPCTPCTIGTYQPSYGQTGCHACRGSKTTFTDGARSSSECQEFDIMFPKSNETSTSTITVPAKTVRDFSVTFWVQVNDPRSPFPSLELYNTNDVKVWTFTSLQNITHSGCSTVVDQPIIDHRWHHMTIDSHSCVAKVYIDGILLSATDVVGNCSAIEIFRFTFIAGSGFVGGLSQVNVWDKAVDSVSFSRCFSSKSGNMLKWQDFDDSIITGGYMRIPSQCDDFDNCISSPCQNNATCTDAFRGFQCACAGGFTGRRCEVNIDDCEANICMHESTCLDGVQNYTCLCPSGFSGVYCEIQVVNGKWSEWGNWSECTTSCGDGSQSRKRLCTDPTPENGGKDCEGSDIELRDCNNTQCPVCPEIPTPANGRFECINTTDYISCTLTCAEGYDFDLEPLPVYFCGWNTSYEWNFQNDKNPTGRTPNCVAIEYPEQLTVHYSAQYRDLICMNNVVSQDTKESIQKQVSSVVSELACIKNGACSLKDVVITNCDGALRERRRAETAGFTLTIASEPRANGGSSDLLDLQEAFRQFQTAAETGELTTDVLGDEYELVTNSTSVSGDVTCAKGSTPVNYYCIPCGPGTFQYEDYCRPCDVGTYQDRQGSNDCVTCPQGTSTVGILSTSVSDCSVTIVSAVEPIKVTVIALGCCSAVVLLGVVIFVYRRYRSHKEKIVEPADVSLSTQAPIGPSNKRFVVSSQSSRSAQNDTGSFDNHGYMVGKDGIVHHWKPWR